MFNFKDLGDELPPRPPCCLEAWQDAYLSFREALKEHMFFLFHETAREFASSLRTAIQAPGGGISSRPASNPNWGQIIGAKPTQPPVDSLPSSSPLHFSTLSISLSPFLLPTNNHIIQTGDPQHQVEGKPLQPLNSSNPHRWFPLLLCQHGRRPRCNRGQPWRRGQAAASPRQVRHPLAV